MAVYRLVYDSRHLQANCQEPGSATEPYAGQSSKVYLFITILSQTVSVHTIYPANFVQTTDTVRQGKRLNIKVDFFSSERAVAQRYIHE